MKWKETAITRMRLKSVVARVTKMGGEHKVTGFVLNDGTPIKSVEVKIDDGAVAARHDARVQQQVLVEALRLRLEGRHAGRAHDRLARHRRER